MIQEFIDMDTQKIRYVSESSNTSGYSSPAQSPSMSLQAEFSNLNLPAASPQHHQQPSPSGYAAMQANATLHYNPTVNFMNYNAGVMGTVGGGSAAMVTLPQQHHFGVAPSQQRLLNARGATGPDVHVKTEYAAMLRILEQPVEKFRFRYKSEMHGTHGSLNGANSKRTPKTFPEVELCNFNGHAVIRCSLFQTNLESPHSHQLVVRKDDTDICDPHDLHVSPDRGYVAQFQNMGIIHTAKKFIVEELLKKKMNRLRFELGRDELSTKEKQELHKETEKEAKDMNLNQVRLCFEAFKVEDDNTWTRIAAPVYTNPINNRKSAQTGELRICRLSIATGSVSGGDDLILLVEKVSKKNIKVRFYELDEDEGLVWEAFGKFRESDVHHQYAIVCQTPTYKNKDIDKPVEVYIELVRPSDDERSYPPVTFRYKPRDVIVSRKRRRTCSTATSSSGSGSSLSSFELPKPVQEQTANMKMGAPHPPQFGGGIGAPTISEEFNKEDELKKLIGSENFRECIQINSEELAKLCNMDIISDVMDELQQTGPATSGFLETDGTSSDTVSKHHLHRRQQVLNAILLAPMNTQSNSYLQRIFKIYDNIRIAKQPTEAMFESAAKEVADIFSEHAEKNELGDTILHEIVASDNAKLAFKTFHILGYFKLNHLFNSALNAHGESALHCACLHNRTQYIRPLLGLGCDSSIQNHRSDTALHIAVREQHQKCVESFLNMERLRLNLSIKNDEGFTALHLAIRCNDYDVAKMLLQHDQTAAFVPNTKDGNNALHMAVLQQHLDMVKLIMGTQSERQFRRTPNAAGRTPLELAKELNTKVGNEIVAYLASLGSDDGDARLVIKEEEMSCSSTEDDDENEASSLTDDTPQALELVKVKEEFLEINDGEAHDETALKITTAKTAYNLEQILKDEQKFDKLAQMLNASGKWTTLAEACKMQHLLCLWSNAADLLNYVRQKANNIDHNTFTAALAKIDRRALEILQTTYKEANLIDGKAIATQIKEELRTEIAAYVKQGNRPPQLTAILVGDDQASNTYVNNKMQAAKAVGIHSKTLRLPASITQDDLIACIVELNKDTAVDGILVQLPVPEQMDERKVCNAVAAEKDVDGFHERNVGRLCLDMQSLVPATPLGVQELLRRSGIETFGKNAVVIGRSKNVGMPLAMILHTDGRHESHGMDATVTICHRYTPPEQLKTFCQMADIIVSATGVPGIIRRDMVKPGACVIDVGITRVTDRETGKTKLVGDVDFDEVRKVAGHITPVPGGVGPMTVAMLMRNTFTVAQMLAKNKDRKILSAQC